MSPLAEEHRPDDDAGEGGDPDRTEPAFGERLAEDGHAGDDRERVRQERRDPRRGQRAPALEARLEDERSEGVGGDQGGDEGEVTVGRLDGPLGRDVAGREQEPRGDAVRRGGADAAAEQLDRDECCQRRRADPEADREVAGRMSPATAMRTPSFSCRESGTCVTRETSSARMPIPPAAVAWTSESGARASASTNSAQPNDSMQKPSSQRLLPSSRLSEVSGERIVSGGSLPTAPCSSR
jgi:hypothetical protein